MGVVNQRCGECVLSTAKCVERLQSFGKCVVTSKKRVGLQRFGECVSTTTKGVGGLQIFAEFV